MSTDRNTLLLIALALLSTTAVTKLSLEEIQNNDVCALVGMPEAEEDDVRLKVQLDMKEKLGVDVEPKDYFEAYLAYTTGGYSAAEPAESETELKERYSEQIVGLVAERFGNQDWVEFLESNTESDEFSKVLDEALDEALDIAVKYNIEALRIKLFKNVRELNIDTFGADVINTAQKEIANQVNGSKKSKAVNDNYITFIPKLVNAFKNKAKTMSERVNLDYFKSAFNFEQNCLKSLNASGNKLNQNEATTEEQLLNYSRKAFAYYAVLAQSTDNLSEEQSEVLKVFWFTFDIAKNDNFNRYIRNVITEEVDLYQNNDLMRNFWINANYAITHDTVIDINQNNYGDYAHAYIDYLNKFNPIQSKAIMQFNTATSYITDPEFHKYAADMLIGFLMTMPVDIDEFGYSFDQYMDNRKGETGLGYFNILKLLNGILNSDEDNTNWTVIKMEGDSIKGELSEILKTATENFIKHVEAVQINMENDAEKPVYDYALTATEFKRSWIRVTSTYTKGENQASVTYNLKSKGLKIGQNDISYNQYRNQKVRDDGIDTDNEPQTSNASNHGNNNNQDSKLPDNAEPNDSNPTNPKRYHQKENQEDDFSNPDEEAEDIDEDAEEPVETSPRNPAMQDGSNRIDGYKPVKQNIIHYTSRPITAETEAAILDKDFIKRVIAGQKVDGYDEVVYVNVIPAKSDCHDAVEKYLKEKDL